MTKFSIIAGTSLIAIYCAMSFAYVESSTSTISTPATSATSDTVSTVPTVSTTTTTTTTTPSNVPSPVDDAIVSAVYAEYAKTPALLGTALTVSSLNGIVTVNGTVTAQAQADAAIEAAKKIPNVQDVRSEITVITNPNFNQPSPAVPNY